MAAYKTAKGPRLMKLGSPHTISDARTTAHTARTRIFATRGTIRRRYFAFNAVTSCGGLRTKAAGKTGAQDEPARLRFPYERRSSTRREHDMPQTKRSTRKTAKRATSKTAKRATKKTARPPRALSRLEKSVDAAQGALKDLRTELGRGGRDLLKDLEKALSDSRKNIRNLSKTVTKDFGKLQKAATPRRAKTARKRTSARKSAAKKTGSRATKR